MLLTTSLALATATWMDQPIIEQSARDVWDCRMTSTGSIVAGSGGLHLLDAQGDVRDHVPATLDTLGGMPRALSDLRDGRLWVASDAAAVELSVGRDQLEILRRVDTPEDDELGARLHITDLAVDGGITATSREGMRLQFGRDTRIQPQTHDGGTALWASARDDRGQWWAGFAGLRHEGGTGVAVSSEFPVDARDFHIGTEGTLIATMDQGLLRVAEASGPSVPKLVPAGPPGVEHVRRVAGVGRRLCLATPEGVQLRDPADAWQRRLADGLPSNDISALAFDPDSETLWAGTFDQGLAYRRAGSWRAWNSSVLHPHINALAFTREGGVSTLWIATTRGLFSLREARLERWTQKNGLPADKVLSLHATASGELWVGTARGVARRRGDRFVAIGRRNWATHALALDEAGQLWIGTTQGLLRWRSNADWDYLGHGSGIVPDDWVTAILPHDSGVYVGTYAGGVVRLQQSQDGRWRSQIVARGRVNLHGLAMINGRLEIATMTGLVRIGETGPERVPSAAPHHDVTAIVDTPMGIVYGSRRGIAIWGRG